MHSMKYLFGILIFHFIHITITRSDAGKYNKAIQHTLVTFCNKSPLGGGGGEIIYLRLKKRTVMKIITKAKLLGP